MSFLLGEFKELSYNELVEINGGGNGTLKAIVQKVANAVKGNNKQGSGTGSGSGSSGGGG